MERLMRVGLVVFVLGLSGRAWAGWSSYMNAAQMTGWTSSDLARICDTTNAAYILVSRNSPWSVPLHGTWGFSGFSDVRGVRVYVKVAGGGATGTSWVQTSWAGGGVEGAPVTGSWPLPNGGYQMFEWIWGASIPFLASMTVDVAVKWEAASGDFPAMYQVDCVKVQILTGEDLCPAGQTWDPVTQACVVVECPAGQWRNPATGNCEPIPDCPPGQVFDEQLGECTGDITCPPGQYWDPLSELCLDMTSGNCPVGQWFNPETLECEPIPDCPAGTHWDVDRGACVSDDTAPCCPYDGPTKQDIRDAVEDGTERIYDRTSEISNNTYETRDYTRDIRDDLRTEAYLMDTTWGKPAVPVFAPRKATVEKGAWWGSAPYVIDGESTWSIPVHIGGLDSSITLSSFLRPGVGLVSGAWVDTLWGLVESCRILLRYWVLLCMGVFCVGWVLQVVRQY